MTKIRSQGPKPISPKSAARAEGKSASSVQKATTPKTKAAGDGMMPRTNWKDPAKLGAAIDRSRSGATQAEHPRLRHSRKDPISGNGPPIAMRYGLIRPDPNQPPKPPPIAMRYGLIRPDPNQPPKPPPIAMRYGVIRPDPNPPIAMRYGLIRPDPDQPPKPPPIAMRYGLIRPRPGVDTQPRPGVKH